jgi:hypothetical protein
MTMDFQEQRRRLRVSQVRLALLSGVSRFRVWEIENGGPGLTEEEAACILRALRQEARRQQAELQAVTEDLEVA